MLILTLSLNKVNLLHGDVSSSVDHEDRQGKRAIAAGQEAVFECAGQWRQDVEITASLLKGYQSFNEIAHF